MSKLKMEERKHSTVSDMITSDSSKSTSRAEGEDSVLCMESKGGHGGV